MGGVTMAEPTIRERLEADLKGAMRAGDTTSRDAIRYILAAVKNAEIEARGTSSPANIDATLQRLNKQLADSIEQFQRANRHDLAERELAQLEVLKRYLPAELSDEELSILVADAMQETGAASARDMGRVMPVALRLVDGRAGGRRVSTAVRQALGS
jgi:uncharacterized protein YqeY